MEKAGDMSEYSIYLLLFMISSLQASIFSPLLTILEENKHKWLSINHLYHFYFVIALF